MEKKNTVLVNSLEYCNVISIRKQKKKITYIKWDQNNAKIEVNEVNSD